MPLSEKLSAIGDLIRLKRQYGTILVLSPTLWSLYMASNGHPALGLVVIFISGTFIMRSAGCAINDIADRNFDKHVERTSSRPIASGKLSVVEALTVFTVLSFSAFVLVLLLNRLTILLSFGAIGLASIYPFVKRVSNLPQVVLGTAFGWGAIMAWAAVTSSVAVPAIFIFAANIFWSTAYDTVYAMMDLDDDVRIGVKSTAILFGRHIFKAIFLLNLLFITTLAAAGYYSLMGAPFYISLLLSFVILNIMLYRLSATPTRDTAFMVFISNCVVGAAILLGTTL